MGSKKKCQENVLGLGLKEGQSELGPVLYMVAVPIGNPQDLSQRAFETLKKAQFVLAEDTRKAMELSRVHGLGWRLQQIERFDAHRERKSANQVLERMLSQKGNWVLVTDAGTPGFQDPGSLLVRLARKARIRVVPIPGPSALMTFLCAAGLEGSSFSFRGYFPRDFVAQKKEAQRWGDATENFSNWIYFETPERMENTLEFLSSEYLKAQNSFPIHFCGAKELTKAHESFWSGTPDEVLRQMRLLSDPMVFRGEWVFSISAKKIEKTKNSRQLSVDWTVLLQLLLAEKISVRRAVDILVSNFSLNKNEVYSAATQLTKKALKGD
jgi:16S rRNA (cytidine1402-2'-O)-methyltransferase